MAIKVPRKEAKALYKQRDALNLEVVFEYDGKAVTLKRIEVPFQKRFYSAQFTNRDISDTRVVVNVTSDLDLTSNVSVFEAASNVAHFDPSGLKSFNNLDKLLTKASTP